MDREIIINPAIKEAVDKAGSQVALADAISRAVGEPGKVKQQHVWWWLNKSGKVPPVYARHVERLYDIPRHRLNPEVYPEEEYAA